MWTLMLVKNYRNYRIANALASLYRSKCRLLARCSYIQSCLQDPSAILANIHRPQINTILASCANYFNSTLRRGGASLKLRWSQVPGKGASLSYSLYWSLEPGAPRRGVAGHLQGRQQ